MNFRGELPSRSRQDSKDFASASGALPGTIPQPAVQSTAATTGGFLFNEPRQRWLVLLLTSATFFLLLGSRALNEPDEGRYSEIAREMVVSGDWLVPNLWFMPHLDKPPVTYWCEAVSLKIFGLNEWAVRLPLALAALSGLLATFLLARSMIGSRAGWISILLLETSFLYFVMARFLTTDFFLTQFVAWAFYFFWESWRQVRSPAPQWRRFLSWHLAGWVAVALAFMTKGPVALAIPIAGLLALAIFRRRQLAAGRMFFTGIGLGLGLMLILVLPWFLAVFHRQPEAANYMLFYQAFGHLFGITINNRRGSLFYFFGIIAVGLLPWSILLGWLWRREHWRGLNEKSQDAWLLLNVWAIFTFILFSLTHSKLPAYILPIFPALAILLAVAACAGQAWRQLGGRDLLTKVTAGWLALILAQIGLGIATVLTNKAADIATLHVMVGALSLVTGALWCVISFRRSAGSTDLAPDNAISAGLKNHLALAGNK